MGLIQGLELAADLPAGEVVKRALLEKNLVLISAANNTIRMIPPLIAEKEDIDEMISRLLTIIGK